MYQITTSKKSLDQLVKAGKLYWKYITSGYNLPEGPEETVSIELLHLNRYITNRELLEEVKGKGYRLVTFREALEFAAKYPDVQKEHFLGTWDREQLCYLCLDSDGDGRELRVGLSYPGDRWSGRVRFLVVPAPVPVPASLEPGTPSSSSSFELGDLEISIKGKTYKLIEK